MATHDYVIANGTGAAVRSDLNDALAAIVSNNSGSSEPATTYAYQWWADTTANVLKIRNSANNAWITLRELDGTLLMEDGSNASPGLAFASDLDTGFFRGGDNQIGFATAGVARLHIGSSEVVFNDPSNDVDFRVESNGNTHMLFVDAGNDRVGINESSPSASLHVNSGGTNVVADFESTDANAFIQIRDNSTTDTAVMVGAQGDDLLLRAGSNERARIDSSGRLLLGVSSARGGFDNNSVVKSDLQVEGVGSAASANRTAISIVNNGSADADSAGLYLARSGGTSVGSFTAVTANDVLARITFSGADGSEFVQAASIEGVIDGTPGGNDMPGRLVFSTTADGGVNPTERLRIDSSGNVGIGQSNPSGRLEVNGGYVTLRSGASSFPDGISAPVIYGSTGGGSGPFDQTGNLVLQTRSDAGSYSICMVTGDTPAERMRIDSSGNVGIGTSSPTDSNGFGRCIDIRSSTGAAIYLRDSDDTTNDTFAIGRDNTTSYLITNSGNLTFSVAGSERMRIDSSGRVGIGVSTMSGGAGDVTIIRNSALRWADSDGTQRADIYGDSSSNIVFRNGTSSTERMRITSAGVPQFSTTGSFYSSATTPSFRVNSNGDHALTVNNQNATDPRGLFIFHDTDVNNSTSYFIRALASGANKFYVYSNGGVGNVQSNNVNLCDEREKKNIASLDTKWDKVKSWDLKKFHYNEDADTDDLRYGVIAQQVEEHCPEVLAEWDKGEGVTRKAVKEQQMMWMAIKALQEAQTRIETLEAKVAALEAQ